LFVLLLITIGRNARVDQATANAESEALRLLAAYETPDTDNAGSALLAMLCERGQIADEDCKTSKGVAIIPLRTNAFQAQLDCLPGWRVETFREWMTGASFDRQVAALATLASCEIRVVDPVGEEAAQEAGGSSAPVADDELGGGDQGGTSDGPTIDTVPEDAGIEGSAPTTVPDEGTGVPEPTSEAVAAVREALQVQRSEIQALEAISSGADELLSFASGPTRFGEFRFSGAAWLVVLAAALLWYRQLEIRVSSRRLGPIDVRFEKPGSKSSGSNNGEAESRPPENTAEAVFKEAVIRNVPEPGAIPGGEALAPVGDLVAQSDVPQKWLVGGVIDAARTVFATRGGFTVIFS
jgi:hypothetical protein